MREGDDIPEADPDSSEVLIHTDKVAVLVKVSREQYATGSAATMLSDATRRALIRKANVAYLSQALRERTGNHPTGPVGTPPAIDDTGATLPIALRPVQPLAKENEENSSFSHRSRAAR